MKCNIFDCCSLVVKTWVFKVALNLFPRTIIYCNAAYLYSKDIPSSLLSGQCSEALIRNAALSQKFLVYNLELRMWSYTYSCNDLNSYMWDPCLYIFVISKGTLKILFIQSLGKTTQRLMCLFMMEINRYIYPSKLPLFRNPFFSPNEPQNHLLWFQFGLGSI